MPSKVIINKESQQRKGSPKFVQYIILDLLLQISLFTGGFCS